MVKGRSSWLHYATVTFYFGYGVPSQFGRKCWEESSIGEGKPLRTEVGYKKGGEKKKRQRMDSDSYR